MQAADILRAQLDQVHQFVEMTIGDVPQDALVRKDDGWTINPIGSLYRHIVTSEDSMISGMALGSEPLLTREGWSERLGVTEAPMGQTPEAGGLYIDLPALQEYAQAVAKQTDEFLANASESDLMQEVPMPGGSGPQQVITLIATVVVTHAAGHWGEIAALKGVQGLKGLPF